MYVVIPEFVFLLKKFQPQIVLILFLFSSDFSLDVLIKFVLNKNMSVFQSP